MIQGYCKLLRNTAAWGLLLAAGLAMAQTSIENLFRNPRFGSAVLSPNGRHLATTTNISGRLQLAVVDLETGAASNVAGYEKLDVFGIRWINNERIAFHIVDRDGEQTSSASGLYAINRDASQSAILMQSWEHIQGRMDQATWASEPRGLQMLGVSASNTSEILALGYFPNGDVVPYRVDSLTGKRREVDFDLKGLGRGFVFDSKDQLRVVVTTNASHSELMVWYRENNASSWNKLSEHSRLDPRFSVLGFDADDATMIVSAPTGDNRLGIYKFDFANKKPGELLASDSLVDVGGGLVFAPDSRKLLGVRIAAEPPRTIWFDRAMASLQAGIDKAFPGMVNDIHPRNAQAPMLIHSYSSTHPGQYTLYYPDKKKLQNLFALRPWIDPKTMAVQQVYDYQARDGLPIISYLTLPGGRPAKALPLVVRVHGGPWLRDHWGFSPEVQFLAGLGYAVLQPQFRGSTGFGDTHLKKSFGQWGLAMQDDITDGVNSLVKQGVVDPRRICIMGTSYGGYASMMGLVKDPDLYRCGVNLMGVTNLFYIAPDWSAGRDVQHSMKEMLGDVDALRDQFVATSPSKHADRIKAPVFMAYGEKDRRVPLVHGEEMRDALKKLNKTYEYLEMENEEHGMAREETRYRIYGAIEAFLKKHNPLQ